MRDCDERRGCGRPAQETALESNVEGDLADAGGGARADAFDGFGDLGAVGRGEGAFFFDVLAGRGGVG